MQVEAHAKFRGLHLADNKGNLHFVPMLTRNIYARKKRRKQTAGKKKERKEKPKKAFRTITFWRERESARHILKGSTPWNPILGPNIRRIFLRFRAPIRLFPMYHRSRTFFSLETMAQIAGVRPTAPGEACKTKILLRPLVTKRPPPLLRRLLRPARSFAPSSPGPSSSHPFLLLPTRLFFLIIIIINNLKPSLLLFRK